MRALLGLRPFEARRSLSSNEGVSSAVTLVGGGAGRLKPGGLVDAGPQTYHRLGCTMLDLMGAPSPGFGEEQACGVPGVPTTSWMTRSRDA